MHLYNFWCSIEFKVAHTKRFEKLANKTEGFEIIKHIEYARKQAGTTHEHQQTLAKCVTKVFRGTIFIHTTTGFGFRKNKKMAGVYNVLVYMQIAKIYSNIRPRDGFAHHGLFA